MRSDILLVRGLGLFVFVLVGVFFIVNYFGNI